MYTHYPIAKSKKNIVTGWSFVYIQTPQGGSILSSRLFSLLNAIISSKSENYGNPARRIRYGELCQVSAYFPFANVCSKLEADIFFTKILLYIDHPPIVHVWKLAPLLPSAQTEYEIGEGK